MSETPNEQQPGINEHGREQAGAAEARSRAPGSRSLQAGGEFLKALADDLAIGASRLRPLLTAHRRRTRPPSRLPEPSRSARERTTGRTLWRLGIALFGIVSICAGVFSAATLWVFIAFPPETRRSEPDTLTAQFEARKGESHRGAGPLQVTGTARQDSERSPEAPGRPDAEVTNPSIALSGTSQPPRSDDGAGVSAERSSAWKSPVAAPTGGDPAVLSVPTSTDLRRSAQCNVGLCSSTYRSFHAADCTYQPYTGGSRRVCELNTRSAHARPQAQTPRATTDPSVEEDTQVAQGADDVPESATPAGAGLQCNVSLCTAAYASFHAADCTYQPHGGGPRRICER